MSAIVFHNCKPDESSLVVSLDGATMTADELDRLLKVLNDNESARIAVAKAFDESNQ